MTTSETLGAVVSGQFQRVTSGTADAWLPAETDVGRIADWYLPSGDEVLRTRARFLGVGASYSDQHRHHGEYASASEKCRACRWFEPRIFRECAGQRRFLVHRTGRSIVPGEVSFTSHEWIHGAHEVVEALTTRRRDARTGSRTPYLTHPAARVLAQAASHDDDLSQAYVDRAVA
jgi:hypothetical protein